MLNDAFQVVMLANEFKSGGRADAFNGVEVVAAEKDAEIDELQND